ncbi:hypothetical protein PIB30_027882 [Stylosanthes scabra]|uniref:Aminotransferase-like plant mobile domain-containing protein n=1 Tax=Stylosanthes scabra TaxID=79078 RepID=A0ABU6X8Y3_9FABA|nr:hypothetical protein [Stylosanthes scabra]
MFHPNHHLRKSIATVHHHLSCLCHHPTTTTTSLSSNRFHSVRTEFFAGDPISAASSILSMTRNGKTPIKGSASTAAGSTIRNLSQPLLRSCFRKVDRISAAGPGSAGGRLLQWRSRLDRVTLDQFCWTPYHALGMQALIPDWMRSRGEIYTWRSAVPVMCFNFVHMHYIDRVIRQYGGEQPIPRASVDVTRFMSSTGRGDDVWWPERHIHPRGGRQ